MKDVIKKLELAETELTGEPSEENAAEALLLIKDVLQVLRQTSVSGWRDFKEQPPNNLDIVAIRCADGHTDFGVYQERWGWVSCTNDRIFYPVQWFPLPACR